MKTRLVLASASPRRQELLKQIGLEFTVKPSSFVEDEGMAGSPGEVAMHNALGKAREVAAELDSGLILGADTVVVCDEHLLGKPRDREDAERMLRLLSGRWHEVLTAVALVDASTHRLRQSLVRTRVHMHVLSASEIEGYLNSGEPFDKAGAYGIQGLAAQFIDRIDGCYFNVVGLPLSATVQMMQSLAEDLVN